MLRKHHFIRDWEVQSLSAHSHHLSSYSSRLCLGYFVGKEQNYDVTKFSHESLWHPGIHWEWLLFSLPNLQKAPLAQVWDLQGWPDTPSDNLELPWQSCSSCPACFSLPDSQIASATLSLYISSSIQLSSCCMCLLPFLGTVGPRSQKAYTIKRGAAFPSHLALRMRNPKVRGWSTQSDFFLGSSSTHKYTQPRAMHTVDTARPGVGCAYGEGLASVILLWYFSCSEVNLTLSFINSARFVHIRRFHMEVHVSFLTFNLSKCLCTHKQEHPTSLHHSWEQQVESAEPSSDWGGRAVTNHYFLFPCPSH